MLELSTSNSPQGQLAFLRLAAEDDHFRSELRQNPVAALARHGLRVAHLPEKVELPAKETIRTALAMASTGDSIGPPDVWGGFIAD